MKAFIAALCLLTMITAQAATVSAKALLGIESRITLQRDALNDKLNAVNTTDITEGKIVAAMANMIESKLELAEQMLNSISESDLTEENIAKINSVLDESELLIEEI
jgi:hypothetical protein